MRLVILLLIASSAIYAQSITSITCWGIGGKTCYDYDTSPIPSGAKSCRCAATCFTGKNTVNIGANYRVWWSVAPDNGTGGVQGGALSFGVRVNGSVMLYCDHEGVPYTRSGEGYDAQDCKGVITPDPPDPFFITC